MVRCEVQLADTGVFAVGLGSHNTLLRCRGAVTTMARWSCWECNCPHLVKAYGRRPDEQLHKPLRFSVPRDSSGVFKISLACILRKTDWNKILHSTSIVRADTSTESGLIALFLWKRA